MSEELSRVKSRQKKSKDEARHVEKVTTKAVQPREASAIRGEPGGNLTRAGRTATRSRVKQADKPDNEGKSARQDGESTPSRARTYTSERVRLSKMFVNSLIVLFVMLLVGLLWWGIEGAPELRTLLW